MKKLIVFIVLLVLISCFFISSLNGSISNIRGSLPLGASDIKNVGNQWITFEWEGGKYLLYYNVIEGNRCITKMN